MPINGGRKGDIMAENEPRAIKLTDLKLNDGGQGLPKNPRFIRDDRFKALCESVRDNPEFMPARPIVVDENGVILGGNMRYRACRDLGMTEVPASWVDRIEGLTVEKKRRFILMDNHGFGEWDWDLLANDWGGDIDELVAGGFQDEELTGLVVPDENKPIDEGAMAETSSECPKCGFKW